MQGALRVLGGHRAGWVHAEGVSYQHLLCHARQHLGWFAATILRAEQAAPGMKSKRIISMSVPLPSGLELFACCRSH